MLPSGILAGPSKEEIQNKLKVGQPINFNVTFNASGTTSPCLETLIFKWDFGDETGEVINCTYPYTECLYYNHTYTLNSIDDIGKIFYVTLEVDGTRSGYFGQSSTVLYISDPFLEISELQPDSSRHPCLTLKIKVTDIHGSVAGLGKNHVSVNDNYLEQNIDGVRCEEQYCYITYRATTVDSKLGILAADRGTDKLHKIAVKVTPKYQSVEKSFEYTSPAQLGISITETVTYGGKITKISNENENYKFYDIIEKDSVDVAAGDIDGDGVDEIVLVCDDKKIRAYNLFVSNDGTIRASTEIELGESKGALKAVDIIDYNGDGVDEIVYLEKLNDNHYIRILDDNRNLDIVVTEGFVADKNKWTSGVTDIAVGDIDGDGQDEVVFVEPKRGSAQERDKGTLRLQVGFFKKNADGIYDKKLVWGGAELGFVSQWQYDLVSNSANVTVGRFNPSDSHEQIAFSSSAHSDKIYILDITDCAKGSSHGYYCSDKIATIYHLKGIRDLEAGNFDGKIGDEIFILNKARGIDIITSLSGGYVSAGDKVADAHRITTGDLVCT